MIEIKVPEAGESITEGVLLEWHVGDGDHVRVDDELFELETDKITMTVVAEASGAVAIGVPAGEKVSMGQVVGTIDESAEAPEPVAAKAEASSQSSQASGGASATAAPAESAPPKKATPSAPPPPPPEPSDNGHSTDALPPSVRRLVAEHGIDPAAIHGTGRSGRVTAEDVMNFLAGASHRGSGAPSASTARAADGPRETRERMSSLRKRIAERLVHAQQTAAILTTFNEADMSAVMRMRSSWRDAFEQKHGVRLGFMSFFVKATVEALKAVPALNARIDGDEIVQNHFYDIGVAVGTEHGLVVPVVRDCDTKSFAEIEHDIADFATRARKRKLELSELEGGCFTISNGGVYGSMLSTPILNPPQSGILGLHAITKRPVEVDGEVAIRPVMYLAMSYDHRVVDGTEAVTFLKRIKDCIEDPSRLVLDI